LAARLFLEKRGRERESDRERVERKKRKREGEREIKKERKEGGTLTRTRPVAASFARLRILDKGKNNERKVSDLKAFPISLSHFNTHSCAADVADR
jgi:hypothetical protein